MGKNSRRMDSNRKVLRKGEDQRPDGTYQYRWSVRGKRNVIYGKTLEELREKEKSIQRDILDGISTSANALTVDMLYERWKQLKRGIRENTFQNYMYMYETFAQPVLGSKRITTLKKTDVRAFYIYLNEQRGLKPATMDAIQSVLHPVLQIAVDDNYIRENPSNGAITELKKAIGKAKQKKGLTVAQQELLLNFLRTSNTYKHWYPVVAFMLGTGMRVGEVTGLQSSDVALENRLIIIKHTLVYYCDRSDVERHKCRLVVHDCAKTVSGCRTIPMSQFVLDALNQEKQYQVDNKIKCREAVNGYKDFVFLNRDGKPLVAPALNKAFRRIIRDCNLEQIDKGGENPVLLPNFSCHTLRHTFTDRMVESNMNVKALQAILGHKDISMTLGVYADASNDFNEKQLADAMNKIDCFDNV